MDYDALAASTEAAVDRAHKLAGELRDTEAALSKTSELMGAVVQYAKTRPCVRRLQGGPVFSRKVPGPARGGAGRLPGGQSYYERSPGRREAPENGRAEKGAPGALSKRERPSMRNTARPRRKCGRPWRSRRTLTICSAIRTGVKIRPRSDSSGPQTTGACAWTSGQSVQKSSGFGELPNKHFRGALRPCENFGVCPHPNCLPFCASPENGAKKRRYTLFLRILRFAGFLQSLCCVFHYGQLFFVH